MTQQEPAGTLKLRFLGAPQMERDGVPVTVDTRKAIALAAYLAVTGQAHSRETLAALLWPEYEPRRAFANLRRTLWSLNKAVGSEWLDAEAETVSLVRRPGWWLDVQAFRDHLDACRSHGHPESEVCSACLPPLQAAAELYRDEFLAGFTLRDSPGFDDWQFFQAEALRDELASALERLVRGHVARGECGRALPHARRWLALDPLQETAHRQVMKLYAWAGRRAAALRQYQECMRILEEELGVPPEDETAQLYEAIRSQQLPPMPGGTGLAPQPAAGAEPGPPAVGPPVLAVPSNLPVQPTPFVGRKQELIEMARLLRDPDCRLLTLIGPGGIGKTRLAVQAAARASRVPRSGEHGAFAHGVYFVPLAPLASADLMVPAIADALTFSFFQREDESPTLQLLNYLRGKQMLLLLDNFEHLLAPARDGDRGGASLLLDILQHAPGLKLLVTSRERLNLRGEWIFEVGGMPFPREGEVGPPETYSAVRLFLQSARQAHVGFSLPHKDLLHLVRICQLVEGMPLGIELAAAWTRVLSCREIAAEIEQGLDFLTSSLRDLPERHRSLRAVFDHSWRLLSPAEQEVFRRLSAFRGGFRLEAAAEVAGAGLALLTDLVDKSLVRRGTSGRYELHQLLREYAGEKLAEDPAEAASTHNRHCRYFVAYVKQREGGLTGPGQKQALDEISLELEDVRAAWYWAVEQGMVAEVGPALRSLQRFYDMRSRFQEALEAFGQVVAALETGSVREAQPDADTRLALGLALACRGWFEHRCYRHRPAVATLRHSLEFLRPLDRSRELAWAHNVAIVVGAIDDPQEVERLLEENLSLFAELGERSDVAVTLLLSAAAARFGRGDFARCETYLRQSLEAGRESGDRWSMAYALFDLGELAQTLGARQEAKERYQESLAIRREIGDGWGAALCLDYIGYVARELGEFEAARQFHQESLALSTDIGDRLGIAGSLDNLGLVARDQGQYEEAKRYLGKGLAFRAEVGRSGDLGNSFEHLGELALTIGDVEEAARRYQQCLAAYESEEWLPFIARAHRGLGEVALLRADEAGARQYFAVALAISLGTRQASPSLDVLAGWAQLLARTGEPERAAEVLSLVRGHAACSHQTRQRAGQLLAGLEATPGQGAGKTLEEMADELLAEARRPR